MMLLIAHHGSLEMSFRGKSKACAPHVMPVTLNVFTVHARSNKYGRVNQMLLETPQ